MLQYVVGIDGGGTKTRMKIADRDGNLLTCCEGGPANINSMDAAALEEALAVLTATGLDSIGGNPSCCGAICLGMSGAGRREEKLLLEDILNRLGFCRNVIVTDDAQTALYGGVGKDTGIILISGTGSICYGRNCLGQTHRAGGWGYILGDEGSGYDIGLRMLKLVLRSLDGREGQTLLSGMIMEHLKIKAADDIVKLIYRSGEGRRLTSALAPIADEAVKAGDEAARGILDTSVSELFLCTKAVISALGFSDLPVAMAFGGSVLLKCGYINRKLRALVSGSYPGVSIIEAADDAAGGALRMALGKLDRKE